MIMLYPIQCYSDCEVCYKGAALNIEYVKKCQI